VEQGGVEVNGEKMTDASAVCGGESLTGEGLMLKKGKKVFHRVRLE
jgi:tyrosyl-tRNA synthetase